jgi:hypothetical protein
VPIADWISNPIATERHERLVPASPERAVEIALEMPTGGDRVVGTLSRLRGMKRPEGSMEDFFKANGFVFLKREPREVVVGIGSSARLFGARLLEDPAAWHGWDQPNSIKAAANFLAEPAGEGRSRLSTETWVEATDDAARRRFRLYWLVVGPFSALIRRRWLASVAKLAEAER